MKRFLRTSEEAFDTALSLNLPDLSGQIDLSSTVTFDMICRASQAMLKVLQSHPGYWEERYRDDPNIEPFVIDIGVLPS